VDRLLRELDLSALSPSQLRRVERIIGEIEGIAQEERKKILHQMQDLQKLKKFRY